MRNMEVNVLMDREHNEERSDYFAEQGLRTF